MAVEVLGVSTRVGHRSGFGYTNPLLSSVFSDLTHLKPIVIFL